MMGDNLVLEIKLKEPYMICYVLIYVHISDQLRLFLCKFCLESNKNGCRLNLVRAKNQMEMIFLLDEVMLFEIL